MMMMLWNPITGALANSADPDEMLIYVEYHQGLLKINNLHRLKYILKTVSFHKKLV